MTPFYRLLLSFIIITSIATIGRTQDANFTQYYQTPGQFNPALVGSYGGLFRVGINYRTQWSQALDNPYETFAASGDVKFNLGDKRDGQDIFALGIQFLSDRTDIFDLNTTGIALTGAFHKSLDYKTKQYLSGGVQAGIFQRNLNFEDLTFQDQFNAIDAFEGLSAEDFPVNNYGAFDLNIGINYSISPSKKSNFTIGGSVYHLLPGNRSFFEKNEVEDPSLFVDFFQFRRFNVMTSYAFPVSETTILNPRVLYAQQGPHNQIMVGNLFKVKQLQDDTKQFYFGPAIRMNTDEKGFNVESLILQGGIEYNGLIFGLSYDHNVQDLFNQRQGLGIVEFSLNFLGEYVNEDTFCPTF